MLSETTAESTLISIPRSLRIVVVGCILGYVSLLIVLFRMTSGGGDDLIRLLTQIGLLLVSTMPLWNSAVGTGVLHPLFIVSGIGLISQSLAGLEVAIYGIDFHLALPGLSHGDLLNLHSYVNFVTIVSWISLFVGYYVSRGISWRLLCFTESRRQTDLVMLLCLVASLLSLYMLMNASGGISRHLVNIAKGAANKVWVKDAEWVSLYGAIAGGIVVCPGLYILVRRVGSAGVWFYALSFLSVFGCYLINGRRSAALRAILVIIVCWTLSRRQFPTGRVILVGFLVLLFVGIADEFRRTNWRARDNVDTTAFASFSLEDGIARSLEVVSARRRSAAIYPILARVPSDVGYLYGQNYLSYIYRFVPRFLWKEKPRGIGILCAEEFYGRYNTGGVPPGAIGEAYWAGGVVGVVVIYVIWGFVLRSAFNWFSKFGYSSLACLLYLMTLAILGPSEQEFRAWLFSVGPLLVLGFAFGLIRIGRG